MTKKICCLVLICLFVLSSFCVTAYADDGLVWDFLLTWMYDTYTNINTFGDIANDPDALIDYYSTDDGRRAYDLLTTFGGSIPMGFGYVTCNDLDEAVAGRYMTAELKRQHVNALYDQINDYWSNDSANIRNITLDDLDIDIASDTVINGSWGYLSGAGPAILKGSYSDTNNYVTFFNFPDGQSSATMPSGNHLYVYNGSPYYPPMLYTTAEGVIKQGERSLPRGLYCVLNSKELWYASPGGTTLYDNIHYYYTDSGSKIYCYCNFFNGNTRVTSKVGNIYINGNAHEVGYSDGYDGYTVLDKFSKAIGLHITTDDTVEPKNITPPDDIPYDDDDTVVVLLPADEPGAPIYMSPTVYNNYYNNGDIVDSHDTTNNYFTDDQIQQIINNYNNYKSEYDDSKILGKLNVIIDKLNDIYNAVKHLGKLGEVVDAVPIYDNFSDCITTNVPLIADIQNLVDTMRVDEASSGFDDAFYNASGGMHPSGVSSGYDNLIPTLYDGFSPDVGWYAPYRNDIRNLLKLFCYGGGIVAVWYAVRSVFGIHGGGDED